MPIFIGGLLALVACGITLGVAFNSSIWSTSSLHLRAFLFAVICLVCTNTFCKLNDRLTISQNILSACSNMWVLITWAKNQSRDLASVLSPHARRAQETSLILTMLAINWSVQTFMAMRVLRVRSP